jgi:hypothetical protein
MSFGFLDIGRAYLKHSPPSKTSSRFLGASVSPFMRDAWGTPLRSDTPILTRDSGAPFSEHAERIARSCGASPTPEHLSSLGGVQGSFLWSRRNAVCIDN